MNIRDNMWNMDLHNSGSQFYLYITLDIYTIFQVSYKNYSIIVTVIDTYGINLG